MSVALFLCGAVLVFLAILFVALILFAIYIRRRVEAAVPPLGRFVQMGETRLHVVERGVGPTLVLVHGGLDHARCRHCPNDHAGTG